MSETRVRRLIRDKRGSCGASSGRPEIMRFSLQAAESTTARVGTLVHQSLAETTLIGFDGQLRTTTSQFGQASIKVRNRYRSST